MPYIVIRIFKFLDLEHAPVSGRLEEYRFSLVVSTKKLVPNKDQTIESISFRAPRPHQKIKTWL